MKKKILGLFLIVGASLCITSCNDKDVNLEIDKISIVSPSGSPAISMANLYSSPNLYDINNTATPADLQTYFVEGNYDVIFAPVNMGAIQYYNGNTSYKLDAVITWGNLYIASQQDFSSLTDLEGKTIKAFGNNTINRTIVDYALSGFSIDYSSLDTNATKELLLGSNDVVVIAEPALSAASTVLSKQNISVSSLSIQDLYMSKSGSSSYPQAGVFVRYDKVETKEIELFRAAMQVSSDYLKSNLDAAADIIVEKGILPAKPVALKAIPNCNINYVDSLDARSAIEAVCNLDKSKFGGALPQDEFYI